MKYNEKIVALRKANGFTQEGFAKAVSVTRQAVYKWEVGDSYPEAEKLLAIKALFGISIDDLLDDNFDVVVEKPKKTRTRKPKAAAPAAEAAAPAAEKAAEEKAAPAAEEKVAAKAAETAAPAAEKVAEKAAAAEDEDDEFNFTVSEAKATEKKDLFDLFRHI